MVNLFKHKPSAINSLEAVRLNPDLVKMKERTDLEFFIPQLVSFYLQNEMNDHQQQQLISFLEMASKRSIFFAQRLWFFLNSNMDCTGERKSK